MNMTKRRLGVWATMVAAAFLTALVATLTAEAEPTGASVPVTFAEPQEYPAGSPTGITNADLDGDGDQDVATTGSSFDGNSGGIRVLLNGGDGTFGSPTQFAQNEAFSATSSAISAADLDGDGDRDIAAANTGRGTVTVLLGRGDGTFWSAKNFTVGSRPAGVEVADLNGDGTLDLAVSNAYTTNDVSVLLGKGDGTFGPAKGFPTDASSPGPVSVAAADLDGDGDLDLATANGVYSDDVSVLLNKGDGTFGSPRKLSTGDEGPYDGPYEIISADLNRDGRSDIATANSDKLSVLLNKGGGTFAAVTNYSPSTYTVDLVAADLDGDGDLDLATTGGNTATAVLQNKGDGTFGASSYFGRKQSSDVTDADFDGDGRLDLATLPSAYDTVSVLINTTSTGSGEKCTVVGTGGDDVLTGTDGDDVICARGGADEVRGSDGDDTIYGGGGKDVIFGELGNDHAYGRRDSDRVYGGAGRDFISGGLQKDHLDSRDAVRGNDRLYGGRRDGVEDTYVKDPGDKIIG